MPTIETGELNARTQIVDAAIIAFAEMGFAGASTREIAKRAGTSQGLLTYHFKNKNVLWYAAVDRMMEGLRSEVDNDMFDRSVRLSDNKIAEALKKFITYNAKNPHTLKFIIEGGRELNERSQYIVDNYVSAIYEKFKIGLPKHLRGDMSAHIFYAFIGAMSTIFSVPGECEYMTGVDPKSQEAIDRHHELLFHLFVPGGAFSIMIKAMKGGVASFKPKKA